MTASIAGQALHWLRAALRRPVAGRFQPYNHTAPNRYPWLFAYAAREIRTPRPRLLSFGCSYGEELIALHRHFPGAAIRGLDIDPRNIGGARERTVGISSISLAVASNCQAEPEDCYDGIFCLAVLCHGDLVAGRPRSCAPLIRFADFEARVAEFAKCLKPGGLLFLHTCNFRFSDTASAAQFEPVLHADPKEMALDRHYDRHDRLIEGPTCRAVGFRKTQ